MELNTEQKNRLFRLTTLAIESKGTTSSKVDAIIKNFEIEIKEEW